MKKCPQFLYWVSVLDFVLICRQLLRAIREAEFSLYLKAIRELLPWMFALDSHNYATWLSVHYRDMCEFPLKHPDLQNSEMALSQYTRRRDCSRQSP